VQPCIDVARRLFSVTHRNGDGALGWNHVATREDSGMSGHHIGADLYRAVLDLQTLHAF